MSIDPGEQLRVLHRLALGVEPFDAMTGVRAGRGVRVAREDPRVVLENTGAGRFKLRHGRGVRDRVRLRVDDPGRRWVPRRFDVELWGPAEDPAVRAVARSLRPRLLPGAAWDPPRGSTCVRGRVNWSGRPVRWPRLLAVDSGEFLLGWAHGDERGEFVLLITNLGNTVPTATLRTLNVDLLVRIPDPARAAAVDPLDPVADLVVEPIARALSQPAPGTAADEVLTGRAAPAGYLVSSVPFPVTVVLGETLARLDVPFNP